MIRITSALEEYDEEDLTPEIISSIIKTYSDLNEDFQIVIQKDSLDGLYKGEIIFGEDNYERLWTKIYIP